jgi:CHAT domain-containing protein/Tfp pilus assembly protein PilF
VNRLNWLRLLAALWATAEVASPSAAPAESPGTGLVVEEVASGSAPEAARLRPGDVLVAWRPAAPAARGAAAGGRFETVLDFRGVQVEQAPRGPIVLVVEREGAPAELTVERGSWDARVRPRLAGGPLEALHAGEEEIAAGRAEDGIARWDAARRALPPEAAALRTWWALRIGEAWAAAGLGAEALAAFEEAVAGAPDPPARVAALEALAGACQAERDLDRAEEVYGETLRLREQTWGDSLELARGLHQLGNVVWAQGRLEEAEGHYRRSLALRERFAPGSLEVAASHNSLGVMAYYSGELDGPAEHYRRALEIRERLDPGGFQVAVLLNNLGLVHYARGELATAEEYYRRVLGLWDQPAPERRELLASVLDNLGNLAYDRGDLERAEDYHRRALAIWEEIAPEGRGIAECVDNLGLVLRARGEHDLAQDLLERGLALREALGNPTFIATSVANLGGLAKARGDLDRAERYLARALEGDAIPAGSMERAALIGDLGLVALERGEIERARELLGQTLALHEELAPDSLHVARTLTHLARASRVRGEGDAAAGLLARALELEERIAPESRDHAETLAQRAALAAARGEPEAIAWYERAIAALEGHVGRAGGSHEARAGLRAGFAGLYRGLIERLLAAGEPERAFAVLERSRARAFLALLAERDLAFGDEVPAELEGERRRLASLYDRTQAMLASAQGEQAAELARELRRLRAEHEAVAVRIRAASPRYAALRYPEPLDLEGARAALDPGTVLLAWSLGAETSHLFVVGGGRGLVVHELPAGEAELRREVEGFRALVQDVRAGSPRLPALEAAAGRLYGLLLAPAETQIAAADRLLLLPEGPLHLLPWAALRRPPAATPPGAAGGGSYLAQWKPVQLALSATAYAQLREGGATADGRAGEAGGDPRSAVATSDGDTGGDGPAGEAGGAPDPAVAAAAGPEPVRVAAFGDPRYRPAGTADGTAGADPAWSAAVTRGCVFRPLPATRAEAEAVAGLWGDGARVFLAEEATEERLKAVAGGLSVLHVAAHGCLDERFPLNSGLALSVPASRPDGGDNGLLQAWEIFEGLHLAADLVVLSACDSALGRELAGEGLLGLTRAFHYAGARSVVASLWQVPDRATADLMARFHRHLRAGAGKGEALRAAHAELAAGAAGPDASPPYFWAGFQLFGDWR